MNPNFESKVSPRYLATFTIKFGERVISHFFSGIGRLDLDPWVWDKFRHSFEKAIGSASKVEEDKRKFDWWFIWDII